MARGTAGKVPEVKRLGRKRSKMLSARLRDNGWGESYQEGIARIPRSEFLLGKTGWRANAEWFLRPGSLEKILEGTYEGKGAESGFDPDWLSLPGEEGRREGK